MTVILNKLLFSIMNEKCTDQCPVLDIIFVCSVPLRRKGPTRCLSLSKPGSMTLVRLDLDSMMSTQSNFIYVPLKRYIWVVDIILLLLLICGNIFSVTYMLHVSVANLLHVAKLLLTLVI